MPLKTGGHVFFFLPGRSKEASSPIVHEAGGVTDENAGDPATSIMIGEPARARKEEMVAVGYAFTALLEREGRLLPVTFGACNYEEAERVAPEIAASLRGKLKDLKLTTGLPPVTVKPTFPEPVFAPRAPRPTMLHAA